MVRPTSWIRTRLDRFAPQGSIRRRVLFRSREWIQLWRREGLISLLRSLVKRMHKELLQLKRPGGIFAPRYILENNSEVTLYSDDPNLFPGYLPRKRLAGPPGRRMKVSLIATTYNENRGVDAWFQCLNAQTRLPDEVIIVDGGSKDGTLEALRENAKKSRVPVWIISEPGANISQGRNIAIRRAHGPVIAGTDFGWRPRPDWLEKIVFPFEDDPRTEVAGGWFVAMRSGKLMRRSGWAELYEVDPQEILPSSRSIAYLKEAWKAVHGYPEWLTLTGEDTYFAAELKRLCTQWSFVPEAVVDWMAPETAPQYWRKIYAWSKGDGESGAFTQYYWWCLVRFFSVVFLTSSVAAVILPAWLLGLVPALAALILILLGGISAFLIVYRGMYRMLKTWEDMVWEMGAEFARLAGFSKGARQRVQVDQRRYQESCGVFFVLSVVPIDDTGGGARSTQITLELLRRGFIVVYVNRFPKNESVDLHLTIRHPNLITGSLESFSWKKFNNNYATLLDEKEVFALVELPVDEFLPILAEIRKLDGVVIYDLLDDWSTSLGEEWYSEAVEKELVQFSQVLVSTAQPLQKRLERLSGREVNLVPNAVNSLLFDPHRHYALPADLPVGEWRVIYIGALWGEWFDWDLLVWVAQAYPQAAVVVIGDYAGQCPHSPSNLYFLGLKLQRTLPAYLAHANVAIIPWKVSPITQATSPLKVYEYIAMRKPVVAPGIRPLQDLPGVTLAEDAADFVAKVGEIAHSHVLEEEAARFVEGNNWQARVSVLLELARSAREGTEGQVVR